MKRFEALKTYWVCALVLSVFVILPGCGKGVAGGGDWNKPVTVGSTSPANGATVVPTGDKLTASFSGAMAPASLTPATFTLTHRGTPVPGSVSYFGLTAVFTPADALAGNTLYTATITTGAMDAAGHALAHDYLWSFTTGLATETIAPAVSFTSPANGSVAVALNSKISAAFTETMDLSTLTAASFKLAGPGLAPVTGAVKSVGPNATFTPQDNLAPGTIYTATITTGAKDLAGNSLTADYVWTFTTGLSLDTTAPVVISTVPLNLATGVATNTVVTASFSEPMDPLAASTATFTLKETLSGNSVPGAVGYAVGGRIAAFTSLGVLKSGVSYTAAIKGGIGGVADLAGNAMAVDKVWSFTTGAATDTIAPTVIRVNPADLATGVAINSSVNATFSKAMDPLTLSTATFTVQASGPPLAPALTGTIAYDALSRIASFTPSSDLAPNTRYSATVTTGAADLAGNRLATAKLWSFTTAAAGAGPAPGAIALGSAGTFGIMATSAITNTGLSTINGDVSLDPGTSMGGFPPGVVNGAIHINDTVSALARADLLTAYNSAKNLAPGTTVSAGENLGATYPLGIPPGTYTSGSTMLVSTPLVLDAGGNANAVWVFQIGSSLTTGASVSLANGAQAKNVFWVPTLDATIGVGTVFYGTIVSGRDVTGVTGATINGRILAGATTAGTIALDSNTVNVPAP